MILHTDTDNIEKRFVIHHPHAWVWNLLRGYPYVFYGPLDEGRYCQLDEQWRVYV